MIETPVRDCRSAPTFSVITVTYNDLSGLTATRNSVCCQAYSSLEWVVIDGGSSDGSVSFLQQCDEQNLTWVSEPDQGIYDAMNKGIKKSKGEYLVFLNAGDVFPGPDTLSAVSEALSQNSKPDVLFGGAEYVFPDGSTVFRPPKQVSRSIWHGLPANHQATYYSRNILGGLLYDLKYKICGDYYLIAKLYTKGFRAAYAGISLVKFSVGGASYSNRVPLFLEPYRIQRDVLHEPLAWRLASFLKRGVSTLGMLALKNLHRARPDQILKST